MKYYNSNRESLRVMQRFVTINSQLLLFFALVIFAIALLFSVRYWYTYKINKVRKISAIYLTNIKKINRSQHNTERFISNNNIYGILIVLNQVKNLILNNQIDQAALQLQNSLKNIKDNNIYAIFSIRLARIQLQQQKIVEALHTLNNIKGDQWNSIIAEIRGDAFLSKGALKEANQEWHNCINFSISPLIKDLIQMKIANLHTLAHSN
ncbi:MAG: tetratricopeptide repeat protein [Candidatus Dasytiphilus stammeri]